MSDGASAADSDDSPDFPAEVIQLCDYLAGKVRENGHRVVTVGVAWHKPMRQLIDRDGYTPEQIAQVIDWSTADEFWSSNIRSASKLRQKFDTLKAQMFRDRNSTSRLTRDERIRATTVARHQQLAEYTPAPDPFEVATTRKEIAS